MNGIGNWLRGNVFFLLFFSNLLNVSATQKKPTLACLFHGREMPLPERSLFLHWAWDSLVCIICTPIENTILSPGVFVCFEKLPASV
jgi:hypothetical protein